MKSQGFIKISSVIMGGFLNQKKGPLLLPYEPKMKEMKEQLQRTLTANVNLEISGPQGAEKNQKSKHKEKDVSLKKMSEQRQMENQEAEHKLGKEGKN